MTLTHLLRHSLAFHRRGNLAVLLGVAVGTAVLTGALLVGDALRGSLRDRALRQIGWVDRALVSGRFFRQPSPIDFGGNSIDRGITLRATAERIGDSSGTAGGVTVWATRNDLAVDWFKERSFLDKALNQIIPGPRNPPAGVTTRAFPRTILANEAWLGPAEARLLGVAVGDQITLRVTKASNIPRETLLGRRGGEDTARRLIVRVGGILTENDAIADFSLAPGVQRPLNVFVNLAWLQEQLGEPDRVNVLLTPDYPDALLRKYLPAFLTLDDWGLSLHNRRLGYIALESRSLLIEPAVERAALDVAKSMRLRAAPTLVYLANSISAGQESIPYSVVAALDPQLAPPLGPFLPPGEKPLADDEILLAAWPESPLKVQPGDSVTLTYFDPEQEGHLVERTATFHLRSFVPLEGVGADPELTPPFPGITDKLGLRDWDPPFPYDNTRIQKRDEDYWRQFRTTPKAYISLTSGRKLFGSRFGELTSIRLAPPDGKAGDLNAVSQDFGKQLLAQLKPEQGGFVFEDVRERALRASGGGMDFGLLFLGFSFFLIAAALVLVGLLVRLNLDRRASEVGLLLAVGYRTRTVRRLLLIEGLALAAIGGLLGLAGAIGYAALMLRLLASLWPEGSVGSFLELHITGESLAIGYFAALLVSGLTIWWAVRGLGRVAPSALLAGVTSVEESNASRRGWLSGLFGRKWVGVATLVLAVGLLAGGGFAHEAEERAGMFFTGGMLLLIVALGAVWSWLKRPNRDTIHPGEPAALARLGVRNATRNPMRSLLTAALLASAAFLLVAVESFRRSPEADFLSKTGGSGGFALVAESDLPLYQSPTSREGLQDMLDALQQSYQRDPATKEANLAAARQLLNATTVMPFRLRAGDDTSCLNLYQPGRPRLLGVPPALVERGGFHFGDTLAQTPEERANPWTLLNAPIADDAIPVIGEAHPVEWMLKSKLGGVVEVPDGQGRPVKLRIVGLLQDSVFQGELLMSQANFIHLYPRQEGFSFFLLDPPAGSADDVPSLFHVALAGRGIVVTSARKRLASYLAVENTYLSTFQVLGGFGLLLGALGLAVVLLRNVWERRGELALLRALGYRHRALAWMVFAENMALLLLGLGVGVGSAAFAVAPHVLTGEGAVPWARLAGLLCLVLIVGLAAGGLAVRSTLRAPLVPALRRE